MTAPETVGDGFKYMFDRTSVYGRGKNGGGVFLKLQQGKLALLEHFRYTPVGYRERFTGMKPDENKMAKQFAARLSRCCEC